MIELARGIIALDIAIIKASKAGYDTSRMQSRLNAMIIDLRSMQNEVN